MRTLSSSNGRFVTLGLAAILLAGCASYDAFDENEPGLEQSILGPVVSVASIGIAEEEEPIDYAPRAALVAPPDSAVLPAPREQATATANPNWPTGSRERMAQVLSTEDQTLVYSVGVDGVDIAATQALAERSSQPQRESNSGVNRRLTPEEMQREVEIDQARAEAQTTRTAAALGRRYLTDPPIDSRIPSPDAPYGAEAEAQAEAEAENNAFSWWPF